MSFIDIAFINHPVASLIIVGATIVAVVAIAFHAMCGRKDSDTNQG